MRDLAHDLVVFGLFLGCFGVGFELVLLAGGDGGLVEWCDVRVWGREWWIIQSGIALADDSLCLCELAGAFLDAHDGLELIEACS